MPADKPAQVTGKAAGQGGSLRARPCPICNKPSTEASKPFCSERCRDVDLNRWLSGSYVIPASTTDDEDEE